MVELIPDLWLLVIGSGTLTFDLAGEGKVNDLTFEVQILKGCILKIRALALIILRKKNI